jgi:hypothetical protein
VVARSCVTCLAENILKKIYWPKYNHGGLNGTKEVQDKKQTNKE